jgi:hypothetical protein
MQAQTAQSFRFTAAVLLSALAAFQSGLAAGSPMTWVPTANDIKELEGKVKMPKGAAPLNTFTREYAGRIERGHRLIVGLYSGSGGTIVIDESPPELNDTTLDGGCSIVNVEYDLTIHRVINIRCHGET